MSVTLQTVRLLSRVIRANSSNGLTGINVIRNNAGGTLATVKPRVIAGLTRLASQTSKGGILEKIWNPIKAIAGFIGGLVRGIVFSASKIWSWIVQGITVLKAFDWNATDKSLQEGLDARNVALAAAWGGAIGQGVGWIAGIGIGYGISYLCPVIGGAALARLIATKAGKEAIEELLPVFRNVIAQTAGAIASNLLVNGFIQYRRLLKNAPIGLLNRLYGADGARFIKDTWGNEGGPNMSFNTQMDEAIESIPNKYIKAFVEEFFDEAWDGFTEAGFVIAHEIDEAYSQQKEAQKELLGPTREIEIVPDVQSEDEKLRFISLPQKLAVPAIQTTLNTHRLLYNRDVGEVVGQPYGDWIKARPQLRQLTIVFRSRPQPPWRELNGKKCKEATITIPDCRVGLSWKEIKQAALPYTGGKIRATANLDNRRQLVVYGATAQEAKKVLNRMAMLTTAKMMTLSTSDPEMRPAKLKRDPVLLYPAYATLLARKSSIDGQGRTMIDGNTYDEQVIRIPLWVPKEPKGLVLR